MHDKSQKISILLVATVAVLLLGPMLTLELFLRIDATNGSLLATACGSLLISWLICKLIWRRKLGPVAQNTLTSGPQR